MGANSAGPWPKHFGTVLSILSPLVQRRMNLLQMILPGNEKSAREKRRGENGGVYPSCAEL